VIPDVLFCFYSRFAMCAHRLRFLREMNRRVRVYGLYSGPSSQEEEAKSCLSPWLDDFYSFPERNDSWKRLNFDCMVTQWYRDRGCRLSWESIFVQHWDVLALTSLANLFPNLRADELRLSGYRPVKEIEAWWPRVQSANGHKVEYDAFREYIAAQFGYAGDLFASLLILACLPRTFVDRYASLGPPEIGFLEYRLPTMAKIFGTKIASDERHQPWWAADPSTKKARAADKALNAVGVEVPLSVILLEACGPMGKRVFHPVYRDIPDWQLRPFHARWLYMGCQLKAAAQHYYNHLRSAEERESDSTKRVRPKVVVGILLLILTPVFLFVKPTIGGAIIRDLMLLMWWAFILWLLVTGFKEPKPTDSK
jgi:hypothetical protein